MKLYVIPVETICNGKCKFCITRFREPKAKEFIGVEELREALSKVQVDRIEITGGGEPLLHPEINEIINLCRQKAKTQLYTNGVYVSGKNLNRLDCLCLSRAHYDDDKNEQIMGISYGFNQLLSFGIPLKLSLLLHKSGISNGRELKKYLDWARGKADKVVVRQMFEHDYPGNLKEEYVSSEEVFKELKIENYQLNEQGNFVFDFFGLEVEIEVRSCACEVKNPVLHADGKLYRGWGEEPL